LAGTRTLNRAFDVHGTTRRMIPMRTRLLMAAALAASLAATLPAQAEPSAATPTPGAQTVEPGKVGPGSENNAQVAPTSPSIPIDKQPPPEINLPANSS